MNTARPDIAVLLSHQEWVRELARSLVKDPARADDIAQQTMLEAIARPPRDLSSPKGWLRRVARHAAIGQARQDQRRERRERDGARPEVMAPDPAETVQRAAMHKKLVDELHVLDEPYHTVVLLRFFDDLDTQQIAERLGRPVATVRTQLQRGLARMRERLDREFGDRDAWCTALLPLFASRPAAAGVAVASVGALAIWKWLVPATAAIALAVFGAAWLRDPPQTGTTRQDAARVQAATATTGDVAQRDETPAERKLVAALPVPIAAPSAVSTGQRARVVTLDGRPVPGIPLAYHDHDLPRLVGTALTYQRRTCDVAQPGVQMMLQNEAMLRDFLREYAPHEAHVRALLRGEPPDLPRATTDANGEFAFAGDQPLDDWRVERSDWCVYGHGRLPSADTELLVAGPCVVVGGRIVDALGAPLGGAYVNLLYELRDLPGITQQFAGLAATHATTAMTTDDGRFALGVVPAVATLPILVQKSGYESLRIMATDVAAPVTWTLRKAEAAPTLSGFVYRADGTPAVGAMLAFGQNRGRADANGQFDFAVTYYEKETPLTAWLPDLQPAIVEGLGARLSADAAAGRNLDLRLGGPALKIAGRVVDAAGRPRGGIRVLLGDGRPDGSAMQTLESVIGDQSNDGEQTDRDGRFELRGLSDRPYQVRAIDEQSLLVVERDAVPAGTTDLVLGSPAEPFFEPLEGVVVDRFGAPVAGAKLTIVAELQRGTHGSTLLTRESVSETDASGHFAIAHCPRRHVYLSIDGEFVQQSRAEVPADGSPLRIVVGRQLHFTIRTLDAVTADAFSANDGEGQAVTITAHLPGAEQVSTRHAIPRADSPVFVVPDTATELVLLQNYREVRRVPLHLVPGQLQTIEL